MGQFVTDWDPGYATLIRRIQANALEVWGRCLVQLDCRAYAREIRASGVWGGRVFRQGRERP